MKIYARYHINDDVLITPTTNGVRRLRLWGRSIFIVQETGADQIHANGERLTDWSAVDWSQRPVPTAVDCGENRRSELNE